MSSLNQKIKLLILHELLMIHTDLEHPLKTNDILKMLQEHNIECDRRTLPQDVDMLNEYGYEVMKTKVGRSDAYYVDDRIFDISELKILIDAMDAASFITNKKTEALIGKLLRLCSEFQSKMLSDNRIIINKRKHNNESILYNVEAIEQALLDRNKIQFQYYDLNENKEKVYRHNGEYYQENPISLIYCEDFYYLTTYNEKHDDITHYRIDRMASVGPIDDEPVHPKTLEFRENLDQYIEQIFKMYKGKAVEATFRFNKGVINPIYDRFGEDILIYKVDDEWFRATFTIQISPTFWGWISQFGSQIIIESPDELIQEYKVHLMSILENY